MSDSNQFLPTQDGSRLNGQALAQAMAQTLAKYTVQLGAATDQKPYDLQSVTIDLSIARGVGLGNLYKIGFPFKSFIVTSVSGSATASCSLQFNDDASYAQGIPLTLKDSAVCDSVIAKGYISNAAQPGVTMTIIFSVTTEFRSGSQISLAQTGSTPATPVILSNSGAHAGSSTNYWGVIDTSGPSTTPFMVPTGKTLNVTGIYFTLSITNPTCSIILGYSTLITQGLTDAGFVNPAVAYMIRGLSLTVGTMSYIPYAATIPSGCYPKISLTFSGAASFYMSIVGTLS